MSCLSANLRTGMTTFGSPYFHCALQYQLASFYRRVISPIGSPSLLAPQLFRSKPNSSGEFLLWKRKGLFSSEHCRAGDRLYFWRSLPEPWPDVVSCKGQEGPRTVGQMKPSSESSQLCQDLGLPLSMFIQGTACCEELLIIFLLA